MEVTLPHTQETADLLTNSSSQFSSPDPILSPTLTDYTDQSDSHIFQISSVFPFDLFPDILTIEQNKVKSIFNYFTFSYRVHGVLIRDITDVAVDIHLFLATLTMVDSSNYQFPIEIKISNLQIDEALKARSIIQELVAVQRQRMNMPTNPYRG